MAPIQNNLKQPVYAALALTFAILGDAFLYPLLPVNSVAVGIPTLWVGIILSINRLVRIFTNGFIIIVLAKYGLRLMMLMGVVVAIFSTAGYGFATGVISWLFFRVCWGLSFSAMRVGALGYALDHPTQGLALGICRSLQEVGPMFILFFALLLLNHFDKAMIFILLTVFSFPALYFARKLPAKSAAGWTADKFGINKIFNLSMTFVIVGFLILVCGWTGIGAAIIFTFYSINTAIAPGTVSRNRDNLLQAVAQHATWRDIGAAIGTLAGGVLITSHYLITILIIVTFGLAILLLIHAGTGQKAYKLFYQWK